MTHAPDENRFVAEDGTAFTAVDAEYVGCPICAFYRITPCPIVPSCMRKGRTDKRNIVWKRMARAQLEGESK